MIQIQLPFIQYLFMLMLTPFYFSNLSCLTGPLRSFTSSGSNYDFIDISCFMCSFHQPSKEETEAQRS